MKRQHPIALIGYISRNFWLLLFPLIRGLITIRPNMESVRRWAEGAEWDLLAVGAMFVFALYRWFFMKYRIDEDEIIVNYGYLFKSVMRLRFENICVLSADRSPIHALLGVAIVRIDTDAPCASHKEPDLKIIMPYKVCSAFVGSMEKKLEQSGAKVDSKYRINIGTMAAFSFFFSSAVSGVVLIMTGITGSSKIVGEQLENYIIDLAGSVSDLLYDFLSNLVDNISPVGVKISFIIGVGFIISFLINVVRLGRFSCVRSRNSIRIATGLIVRHIYLINAKKINMVDMRQSLMMKILGIASVHISCSGYGKRKNEIPVFIPICKSRSGKSRIVTAEYILKNILPEFSAGSDYVQVPLMFCWRAVWPTGLVIVGIPMVSLAAEILFPTWFDLIRFIMIVSEIPAVWMLFVKVTSYLTDGFDIRKKCVCVRYSKGYEFHTIAVPFERLAELRISQNPLQRMNRSCDVHIYTASEKNAKQTLISMPVVGIQTLIRRKLK